MHWNRSINCKEGNLGNCNGSRDITVQSKTQSQNGINRSKESPADKSAVCEASRSVSDNDVMELDDDDYHDVGKEDYDCFEVEDEDDFCDEMEEEDTGYVSSADMMQFICLYLSMWRYISLSYDTSLLPFDKRLPICRLKD